MLSMFIIFSGHYYLIPFTSSVLTSFCRITGLLNCSHTWINRGMWGNQRNIWSGPRDCKWILEMILLVFLNWNKTARTLSLLCWWTPATLRFLKLKLFFFSFDINLFLNKLIIDFFFLFSCLLLTQVQNFYNHHYQSYRMKATGLYLPLLRPSLKGLWLPKVS